MNELARYSFLSGKPFLCENFRNIIFVNVATATYRFQVVSVKPGGETRHLLVPANNLSALCLDGGDNGDDNGKDKEGELSELHVDGDLVVEWRVRVC